MTEIASTNWVKVVHPEASNSHLQIIYPVQDSPIQDAPPIYRERCVQNIEKSNLVVACVLQRNEGFYANSSK